MDWFAKALVQSSLIWLCAAVTLGVSMAAHPVWTIYRPAHMHMALLGFVTMMIYGVAYHVLPRFTGHPLWSRRLAGWQCWISNIGLVLMTAGFLVRPSSAAHVGLATAVLASGGVLSAIGAYAFTFNMWRTMSGSARIQLVNPTRMTRQQQHTLSQKP